MIEVDRLSKRYGDVRAVDGVSFRVDEGEIYGLLGPNGAGKTTTLSMISGLLRPDDGRVLIGGADVLGEPIRVKRELGVVPQETAIYEDLSARENLKFWAGLYGLSGARLGEAVDRALVQLGLESRADDAVKTYSGGMKRRLNLGMGLVHGPRAILLDEPTVGIDPQARNNILDVVRDTARSGTTVLYTTHYLEEAEQLCDRIGILDHGRLLVEGTLDELKQQAGEEDVVTIEGTFGAEQARERLAGVPHARVLTAEDGKVVVSTGGDGHGAVELLSTVFREAFEVKTLSIRPPSLNRLFLTLTGRELRD